MWKCRVFVIVVVVVVLFNATGVMGEGGSRSVSMSGRRVESRSEKLTRTAYTAGWREHAITPIALYYGAPAVADNSRFVYDIIIIIINFLVEQTSSNGSLSLSSFCVSVCFALRIYYYIRRFNCRSPPRLTLSGVGDKKNENTTTK